MLAWTVYLSFLASLACFCSPASRPSYARWIALITSVVATFLPLSILIFKTAPDSGAVETIVHLSWVPSLGIHYLLGYDGISLIMVLLTGIASMSAILFSWNIEHRTGEFFGFLMALIGGVYGVFISFDLFLLFVFYEIAIIPKYFLIAIWGSTRKSYGAMKLVLYSFVGSALVLVGIMAAFVVSGAESFALEHLIAFPYEEGFQRWAFPVTFLGFVILAGLWPFHTWAPTGHVAAPTGTSMLLAGVVMKLGAYGALRIPLTLFPMGAAMWREELALLAAVGIVAGALVALVQQDFKFIIGYSSVSHMGFVVLGLLATTETGLSGAVLQMFSHGIIAGLLFAVVGRMVYARTHTRDLKELQWMNLRAQLPFASTLFLLAGLASIGLPGFSGFVAELHVLAGAWQSFAWLSLVAGLGIILGVAYTMRAMLTVFWPSALVTDSGRAPILEPITLQEKWGACLLVVATLSVGLYPKWMLDWITPCLQSPMLKPLTEGMAPM